MKKFSTLLLAAGLFVSLAGMFTSCTKTGETGPAGKDGVDANETCKQCHTPTEVDSISVEFELAKHSWGAAAFEEAGNAGDSEKISQFLTANIPNHEALVKEEVASFKKDMQGTVDSLLAA